jgi:hypothetical protein
MPPNHNYLKFKTLVYTPLATGTAIAAALAWFDGLGKQNVRESNDVTKNSFAGSSSFALFSPEGKFSSLYPGDNDLKYPAVFYNHACHYSLSSGNEAKNVDCVSLWVHNGLFDEWKGWYEWLTKKSFVSQFILGVHEKGIVVSADIPAEVMHCIAMISRSARMFKKEHFEWFDKLVADGIPGEVAYLTCFCVGNYPVEYAFTPSSDHRPFLCPPLTGIKNFLTGEFNIRNEEKTYRNHRSMYCSTFLYGGSRSLRQDIATDAELVTLINESRQANNGGVYKPPNPFAPQKKELRLGEFSYKEVYEIVLPYYLKKGEFNVEA